MCKQATLTAGVGRVAQATIRKGHNCVSETKSPISLLPVANCSVLFWVCGRHFLFRTLGITIHFLPDKNRHVSTKILYPMNVWATRSVLL